MTIFEVTEADESATSVDGALDALEEHVAGGETAGIVDMYERAALNAGATVAQCEERLRRGRERRPPPPERIEPRWARWR